MENKVQNNTTDNKFMFSDKEIRRLAIRGSAIQGSFNYERLQSQGFAYAMIPFLEKLYPEKEDLSAALHRHLAYFNTTPQMTPFILGATLAFEEQHAKNKESFDVESVNSVKVALMGPLAGIGDSFFWGTFRIIGAGIGAPMAIEGNILGAIIFFLVYNIPNIYVRLKGAELGYKQGLSFVEEAGEGGILDKIMDAAKILGLVVIGGMIASMVSLSTPFVIEMGDATVVIQDIVDSIFPALLPLGTTLLIWKLLRKKVSTTILLLLIIVLSAVGVYVGVL
ncbi:MAG: PTS system mannose/fructose/sorbose family transporter subunit IID [Erysipelotrichaceae bacterium]